MRLAALILVALALAVSACHPCPDGTVAGFVMVTDGEILVVTSFDHGGTKWGTLDDTPLSSCREISGAVTITGQVETLAAFDNIERVGGALTFRRMLGFEDVDGFPALQEVGSIWFADVSLNEWEVEEQYGSPLARPDRVSGFNSLVEIRGALEFDHTRIRDVTGFESLRHIGGSFWPWYSPLSNLEGMKNLETIGGNVMAWSTGADFRSLSQLTSIGGSLDIYGLGTRGTLGLVSLREIGGFAHIMGVSPLPDIGLPVLERVGGQLMLADLGGLTSVVGLGSLREVRGDLRVVENRDLPSSEVEDWLSNAEIQIEGDVIICRNQGGHEEPCPPAP